MKIIELGIKGVWLADSQVWSDERGFFREWFKLDSLQQVIKRDFRAEQANLSVSHKGALRGIHYSLAPRGQAKWITCISGSIKDVIVDTRLGSPTFGNWIDVDLEGESGKSVFISEGLGHGFVTLEDKTAVAYLTSTPFSQRDELEINPFDKEIGIDWGIRSDDCVVSTKDRNAPTLAQRLSEGNLPRVDPVSKLI